MCTKDETKQIISDAFPIWRKIVGTLAVVLLTAISSMTLSVSNESSNSQKQSNDVFIEKLGSISNTVSSLVATNEWQYKLIIAEIDNIKKLSIERSKDKYTGIQAQARKTIVDARCEKNIDDHRAYTIEHNYFHKKLSELEKLLRVLPDNDP